MSQEKEAREKELQADETGNNSLELEGKRVHLKNGKESGVG